MGVGGGVGEGAALVSFHTVSAMEVAYSEQARRVRGAANRIPPAFSMQFYNSANQLAAAEIENGPAGREREEFTMTTFFSLSSTRSKLRPGALAQLQQPNVHAHTD